MVKRIREAADFGATHTQSAIDQNLTAFGYTSADPQWVTVQPASTTGLLAAAAGAQPRTLSLALDGRAFRRADVSFTRDTGERVSRVVISDSRGRTVREFDADGERAITWDGACSSGRSATPGMYVVRLFTDRRTAAQALALLRR